MLTLPRRRPLTLRRALVRALVCSTGSMLGIGGGLAAAAVLDIPISAVPGTLPDSGGSQSIQDSDRLSRAEQLANEHSCWTGSDDAPANAATAHPGHVVITWPHAEEASLGGSRAVSVALEHVFEGKHPGVQVHAFCM